MRHNTRIQFTLQFTSKWHTGSGEGNLLIDRLVHKDAMNLPYIAGSTLKGVVRESCERLSRTLGYPEPMDPHQINLALEDNFKPLEKMDSPVDSLFGNKYEGECLFFRDARLKKKPVENYLRSQTRICMYRKIGTAKEKHLFASEYTEPMAFSTSINGYHDNLLFLDENDPPYAYCLLVAGIMCVDRLGGDKSTGSGSVSINIDKFEYNKKEIPVESVFDYLDSEFYEIAKENA